MDKLPTFRTNAKIVSDVPDGYTVRFYQDESGRRYAIAVRPGNPPPLLLRLDVEGSTWQEILVRD